MSYDAGSAHASYILDVEQPKRAAAELRALFAAIKRDAAGIGAPSGIGTGGGGGQAAALTQQSAAAARASSGLERLRDSEIRAARASGEHERALFLINNQLRGAEPNTVRYNNLLAQHTSVTQQAERATQSFGDQIGGALKGQILGIVGPAAIAAVAIKAIGEAGELIKLGAQAEQTRARFNQLGISIDALRKGGGGTISDTALEQAALKANLLGVAGSARELAPLLAIARDRAQQMGISTADAFDSLVTGLGRGSRLILDNIGVMVKAETVNKAYAASVGKTVEALTDQEKKQALINEVLRQGNETMATTGGAIDSQVAKLERLDAGWTNVKTKVGSFLGEAVSEQVAGLSAIVNGLDSLGRTTDTTIGPTQRLGGAFDDERSAIGNLQIAHDQLNVRIGDGRRESILAMQAIETYAERIERTALQSQYAAAQSQDLQVAQGSIARTALAAAQGMLGEGNQADILARKLSITTGQAELLISAQQRIGAASGVGGSAADTTKAAAADAAAARSAQILATGTHAQKLLELNRILQAKLRQFGRGSAEAIAAETNLIQERAAKQRVSAAARTGLQLDTLEQNSGLQLARTQRENLERLRDQQEDFDVGRSRKQEDFDRARIRLLAGGRRFEAARLGEDFARDQRRAREDFDRQRGRTLRNNQEGTGDIDARTDLRQDQILARARLARGGGGGGAAIGGGGIGAAGRGGGGLPALPGGGGSTIPLILKIQLTSLPLQIDGKTFVDATWSEIEQRVDLDLSEELATIGIVLPPGGTQTAVAGAP